VAQVCEQLAEEAERLKLKPAASWFHDKAAKEKKNIH